MEERKRAFFIGCFAGAGFVYCTFQLWFYAVVFFLLAALIDELTKSRAIGG